MTIEAFSRVVRDTELEFGGGNLLDPKELRFTLSGVHGRAEEVLNGFHGPLGLAKQAFGDGSVLHSGFKPGRRRGARPWARELLGSGLVAATLRSLVANRRDPEDFSPCPLDLVVAPGMHPGL